MGHPGPTLGQQGFWVDSESRGWLEPGLYPKETKETRIWIPVDFKMKMMKKKGGFSCRSWASEPDVPVILGFPVGTSSPWTSCWTVGPGRQEICAGWETCELLWTVKNTWPPGLPSFHARHGHFSGPLGMIKGWQGLVARLVGFRANSAEDTLLEPEGIQSSYSNWAVQSCRPRTWNTLIKHLDLSSLRNTKH